MLSGDGVPARLGHIGRPAERHRVQPVTGCDLHSDGWLDLPMRIESGDTGVTLWPLGAPLKPNRIVRASIARQPNPSIGNAKSYRIGSQE